MSHYNVNGSVAKTLIQYLVRWVVNTGQFDDAARDAAVDPRHRDLARAGARAPTASIQSTQAKIGPYELQDFHLYYVTRFGTAAVEGRVPRVARVANRTRGPWPPEFPESARHAYTLAEIRSGWRVFLLPLLRQSQFKRSALPNGPKVVSGGSLSPRGDWRAPSDGNGQRVAGRA